MKITPLTWFSIGLFVFLLGGTYLFMAHLEKQRADAVVAREVDGFTDKIRAIERFYYGLGEFAYEFFVSDPQNKETLESLLELRNTNSQEFVAKSTGSFEKLQKILKSLHVDFVHFHTKEAKSFLRLGGEGGYGDSIVGFRPDVSKVHSSNEPLQSYEIGKSGLLLRNIFPLDGFGDIKSVEFSTPLFHLFNSLAQFDDAHYGAYISMASRQIVDESMPVSKELNGWIFVDGLECDEKQLSFLPKSQKEALLKAMKFGKSHGTRFKYDGYIYFLGAVPLHSTISNETVA